MAFFYLELDNKQPGFDAVFESSALQKASTSLDVIAKKLNIKSVFELMSTAEHNHLCPEGYEETEVPWFDAKEGIDWLEAVRKYVRENPHSVPSADTLVAELEKCQAILRNAQAIESKWHFGMDI